MSNPSLEKSNSFSICVMINTGDDTRPGILPPYRISVSGDLISSLGDLLDAKSGDVRFVCLEHEMEEPTLDDDLSPLEARLPGARSKMHTRSRKRILHAHSQILKGRSEYFRSMLDGEFAESETARRSDGVTTIMVDDASFQTVYWMLRYDSPHN
jgi:hypothetical protein